MATRFSGKGILSGLAALTSGVVESFTLLASRILGFSYTPGGGSSYYTTIVGSNKYGFVGMSNYGVPAYSTDGINWNYGTNLNGRFSNAQFGRPVFNVDRYVGLLTSEGHSYSYVSLDGINWETYEIPTDLYNTVNIQINTINNTFIAIANNSKVYISSDGMNWTYNTTLDNSATNQFYIGEPYVFDDLGYNYLAVLHGSRLWLTNSGSYWVDINIDNLSGNSITYARFCEGNGSTTLDSLFMYANGGTRLHRFSSANNQTYSDTPGGIKFVHQFENGYVVIGYGTTGYNQPRLAGTSNFGPGATWTDIYNISDDFGTNFLNESFVITPFGTYVTLQNGNSLLTTNNGASWSVVTTPARYSAFGNVGGSTADSGQDVYVNYGYQNGAHPVLYSYDGVSYSAGTSLDAYALWEFVNAPINTLQEIQVSIGNQGEEGAEILAPIDVYTVPTGKTTTIDRVTVKNTSTSTITYDLGVLEEGVPLYDINTFINDQAVLAGATATITDIDTTLVAGDRIVLLPSTVDVVEVKVYGTETNA